MQRFDRDRIKVRGSPKGESRPVIVTLSGGRVFGNITAVTVKRAVFFVFFESFSYRRDLD